MYIPDFVIVLAAVIAMVIVWVFGEIIRRARVTIARLRRMNAGLRRSLTAATNHPEIDYVGYTIQPNGTMMVDSNTEGEPFVLSVSQDDAHPEVYVFVPDGVNLAQLDEFFWPTGYVLFAPSQFSSEEFAYLTVEYGEEPLHSITLVIRSNDREPSLLFVARMLTQFVRETRNTQVATG